MLVEPIGGTIVGMESFQIPLEAAERYESAFVPGFFAQWAPALCDLAEIQPGHQVLDVACGTGIAARTAAARAGGGVTGVDLNEAMLTVARRVAPELTWLHGDATELPVPDGAFDVALCQMALMFFPDRAKALAEMGRAVRTGGTVAVVVPAALAAQAAFAPFVELAARHAGPAAMSLLSTYFVCGDLDELKALFQSAGLRVTVARTQTGVYRAPSADAFVTTEVESTPLVERLTIEVYQRIREGTREVLRPFTDGDGAIAAPFECHLVAAVRP